MDQAGIAVAGVAADAFGFKGVGGVSFEAKGNGEGMVAEFFYVVVDGLHARFARERGEWVGLGVEGLGGIRAAEVVVEITVGGEEFFGARVIGSKSA